MEIFVILARFVVPPDRAAEEAIHLPYRWDNQGPTASSLPQALEMFPLALPPECAQRDDEGGKTADETCFNPSA